MCRKPRPLVPGDLVALCSPAGPSRQPARWARLHERLRARAYRVAEAPHARGDEGYLAGPDRARQADLAWALEDPEVAAILFARGGYGVMRILADLPVPDRVPPAVLGYSDLTALHLRLNARGWITFHGPMGTTDLGLRRPDQASLGWLWALLDGSTSPPLDLPAPRALAPGRARGRLLGGNLTLLTALVGTGQLPDLGGAILLLEDVGELPYRIDRMLTQLKLSGALAGLAGIVAGHFTFPGQPPAARARHLQQVHALLAEAARDLSVPCAAGLPSGHALPNLALPLGVEVELDTGSGRLRILEDWLDRRPHRSRS